MYCIHVCIFCIVCTCKFMCGLDMITLDHELSAIIIYLEFYITYTCICTCIYIRTLYTFRQIPEIKDIM